LIAILEKEKQIAEEEEEEKEGNGMMVFAIISNLSSF
jgi:hypothetical protein